MSYIDITTIAPINAELDTFVTGVLACEQNGTLDKFVSIIRDIPTDNTTEEAPMPSPTIAPAPVKTAPWREKAVSPKQTYVIVYLSTKHGFDVLDMSAWNRGIASDYIANLNAELDAEGADKTIDWSGYKAPTMSAPAVVAPIDWDTDGTDDLGYADDDHASRVIAALDTKLYA